MRCTSINSMNQRCTETGEHQEIINSSGQRALVHSTPDSVWTVALVDLQIATTFAPDPTAIGKMMDRARHATPADIAAGGANNEEELLACLRLGYIRGAKGDEPGDNVLGFTIWPNGQEAFKAGWNHAKADLQKDAVSNIIGGAL